MALVLEHFHSIQNLCGHRKNWRLRVKLVRVWNMSSVATTNQPYGTQMVFVDKEVELLLPVTLIPIH
ncbi:hypothetical protein SESBI_23863 [Sesbania bispinosa]|nr:hypothetical protein SESBI_23863 [Sesbania bispinosa]